jgi:hypothetical protein
MFEGVHFFWEKQKAQERTSGFYVMKELNAP